MLSTLTQSLSNARAKASLMFAVMSLSLVALVSSASAQDTTDTVDIAGPVKDTAMDNINAALPAVAALFAILFVIGIVLKLVKKARGA